MKASVSLSAVSERRSMVCSLVRSRRRSMTLALAVLGVGATTLTTSATAAQIENEQGNGKNKLNTSAIQRPSHQESLDAIDRSKIESMSTQHNAYAIVGRLLLRGAPQSQINQASTLTREESLLARFLDTRALLATSHNNYPAISPHHFGFDINAIGGAQTNISSAVPQQRDAVVETEINFTPPNPPRICDEDCDTLASNVIRDEQFAFVEIEGHTRRARAALSTLTPETAALREERRAALKVRMETAVASWSNDIIRAAPEQVAAERPQQKTLGETIRAALLAIPFAEQAHVIGGCGGNGGNGGGIPGPADGRGFEFGLGSTDLAGGALGVAGAGATPGIGDQVSRYKLLITTVGLYAAYQVTTQTETGAALIDSVSNLWRKVAELGWDPTDEVAPSLPEAEDHNITVPETAHSTTSGPLPAAAVSLTRSVVSPEDGDWLRFFLPPSSSDEMTSPSQISAETSTPPAERPTVREMQDDQAANMVDEKDTQTIPKTSMAEPPAEREITSERMPEVISDAGTKDVPEPLLAPHSETAAAPEPELSLPETTDENITASDIEQIDLLEPKETHVDLLEPPPLPKKVAVRTATGTYNSNAWAANTMFQMSLSDRLSSYAHAKAGQQPGKAWARYSGSRNWLRDDSGEVRTKGDKNAILMGFDMLGASRSNGDQTTFGLMGGYGHYRGHSRSSQLDETSSGMVNGNSIGLYGTYQQDAIAQQGLYVDSWALWNRFDQNIKERDRPSERYLSKGVTASLELGYHLKLAERGNVKYVLQPHSQFIYQNVRASDFREEDGTRISFLNGARVQTAVGVRAAVHVLNKSIYVITPYIDVNWLHTSKGYGVRIDTAESSMNAGRNVGQVKIGVQGELDRHVSLNIELVHNQGNGRYHETGGNLTATYRY